MIDLACVCGSRSYNLQIPSSDIDLVIVANNSWTTKVENKDGYNILYNTPSTFWDRFIGNIEYAHIWQFFYPEKFVSDNDVVNYILQNRDELVKSNLPYIYRSFNNCFNGYMRNMEGFYLVAKKRICYGLLYASVLYNYANGLEFAKCLRPDGKWHDILLGIRTGDISFEKCVALKDEYATKIQQVEKFYNVPTDMNKLYEFKDIMDSHTYMTYDEIKEKKLINRNNI